MACTGCKKKGNSTDKVVTKLALNGNFKLRDSVGVIQMNFGSGQFISNSNITDELAVQFLKENPNRISLFEVFPANWKELLNNTEGELIDNKPIKKGKGRTKSK